MKTIAGLLLFAFFSFLITPTVICVIKKNADASTFYDFSEEEKSQKEIIALFNFDFQSTTGDLAPLDCDIIITKSESSHDQISSKIFIPPPKQV